MQIKATGAFEHHLYAPLYLYGGVQKVTVDNVYVSWTLSFSTHELKGGSKVHHQWKVGAGTYDGKFVWGTEKYIPQSITVPKSHVDALTKGIFEYYCKLAEVYYSPDTEMYKVGDVNITVESLAKGSWSSIGELHKGGTVYISPSEEILTPAKVEGYEKVTFSSPAKAEPEPKKSFAPICGVSWIKPLDSWRWVLYFGDDMYEAIIPGNTTGTLQGDHSDWPDNIKQSLKAYVSQKTVSLSSPQSLVSNSWQVKNPATGNNGGLQVVIMELNDSHGWSREKIADWLDTLDEQPTYYKKEEVPVTTRMVTLKPPLLEEASGGL